MTVARLCGHLGEKDPQKRTLGKSMLVWSAKGPCFYPFTLQSRTLTPVGGFDGLSKSSPNCHCNYQNNNIYCQQSAKYLSILYDTNFFSLPISQFSFLSFFFFCLFVTAPKAHGSSQARGLIGSTAAGLYPSHSMEDLSHICDLHHSSRQHRILNPLSEVRV